MCKLMLITLVAVVSFAAAYDFSDTLFNNFLYEQIDLAANRETYLPTLARNRRGIENHVTEKCGYHSKINCCGSKERIESIDEHKAIKGECFSQYFSDKEDNHVNDPFSCEKITAMKNKISCATNCIAEKLKMIENGEPNVEAMKTLFEAYVTEDWQKELITPVIEKCIPIAKAAAEANPPEEGGCSLLAMKLMHCTWRTYQLDCPADKLQTTPKCTKIIEAMKANVAHNH